MSRAFVRASSHYLEYAAGIISAYPFSMCCWFNSDDTTNQQVLMGNYNSVTDFRAQLLLASGNVASDPVRAYSANSGGTSASAATSAGYTANTWYHAAGVWSSATSRVVYLNGGNSGSDTTNVTMSAGNRFGIGSFISSGSRGSHMSGSIAEAALWTVALTAAEVASLATGISPLFIRPASLAAYWPIVGRTSPEICPKGGTDMTVSGATAAAHPRIYWPSSPWITHVPAAAAATVAHRIVGRVPVGAGVTGRGIVA